MRLARSAHWFVMTMFLLGWPIVTASASETTSQSPGLATATKLDPVAEYCLNIADKATDARVAWQTESLEKLKAELEAKIAQLAARQTEVQGWVEKQQEILSAAEAGLVEIYAKMDPEVAAEQLATLDLRLASSLLRQLKPRAASTILNEMAPDRAALLVKSIAAALKTDGTGDSK